MFSIFTTMLFETTKIIIGKVGWSVILERFYTRLLIYSLLKIKELSTNEVIDDTVQDIVDQLKGKKLKVVDTLDKTKELK